MTELNDVVPLILKRLEREGLKVLDGQVDDTPAGPYVVVYTDAPIVNAGRLGSDYLRQILGFRLVCAGRNPGEARHEVSWALSRLARWRPIPGDLSVGLMAPVPDGAPILPDRTVPGDVRFSQTLVFHLSTSRSA